MGGSGDNLANGIKVEALRRGLPEPFRQIETGTLSLQATVVTCFMQHIISPV